MELEALTGGSTKIPLAVLGREIVEKTVEIRWEFSCGLLEAEHELVVLGLSLLLAIGLHVGSVVFEDLHGIFCDADFFRFEGLCFVVGCVGDMQK